MTSWSQQQPRLLCRTRVSARSSNSPGGEFCAGSATSIRTFSCLHGIFARNPPWPPTRSNGEVKVTPAHVMPVGARRRQDTAPVRQRHHGLARHHNLVGTARAPSATSASSAWTQRRTTRWCHRPQNPRNRPLTRSQKEANTLLAAERAARKHGFAHLRPCDVGRMAAVRGAGRHYRVRQRRWDGDNGDPQGVQRGLERVLGTPSKGVRHDCSVTPHRGRGDDPQWSPSAWTLSSK